MASTASVNASTGVLAVFDDALDDTIVPGGDMLIGGPGLDVPDGGPGDSVAIHWIGRRAPVNG
jgi:hypothetical protein